MYDLAPPYGRPQMPMAPPPGMVMPPGYGFPPGMTAPPGVSLPPGMAPPGTSQVNTGSRPGAPTFNPPANLPNINFNAPIIRLGTSVTKSQPLPSGGTSATLASIASGSYGGNKSSGGNVTMMGFKDIPALPQPPTADEQVKTVFVGSIPRDLGDEWLERILKAAGQLRNWSRVTNEDNRPMKFGFAEYEDVESLECAIQVLQDVTIPASEERKGEVKLKIVSDEKAEEYCRNYEEARGSEYTDTKPSRYESARSAIAASLAEFADPDRRAEAKGVNNATTITTTTDVNTDNDPNESNDTRAQPEIVTISLTVDDELADIPADMREMVAKEITAFRERSNRRDVERIRREEEAEQEKDRSSLRNYRFNSPPPPSAPTGPSAGANAIPVGPSRSRGDPPPSAPTQPSRMSQANSGVKFVNGTNGIGRLPQDEDDSDASDGELEERRKKRRENELDSTFQDHERRWLNRERSRTSAVEREANRDREDARREEMDEAAMAARLADWDDDLETERRTEDYYIDRSEWIRNRALFRSREKEADDRDRQSEAHSQEHDKKSAAESAADNFLARQAEELDSLASKQTTTQPRIKMSLGASARNKAVDVSKNRRTVADVEGLLEDEEEDALKTKRVLIPIQYDTSTSMDDETRGEMVKALAQEIPVDQEGLWKWPVKWEFVDESIIKEKLQPFVEKKIVEYLGVQEQELIDFVLGHIRKRGSAEDLVTELEMALGEDAQILAKKIWRMMIFFSESEKRGLAS